MSENTVYIVFDSFGNIIFGVYSTLENAEISINKLKEQIGEFEGSIKPYELNKDADVKFTRYKHKIEVNPSQKGNSRIDELFRELEGEMKKEFDKEVKHE
jgi:hypothetical protein